MSMLKGVVCYITVFLFFTCPISGFDNISKYTPIDDVSSPEIKTEKIGVAVITIADDSELDSRFPDRIISNLNIDGRGNEYCMIVYNCIKPFFIMNCTFHNATYYYDDPINPYHTGIGLGISDCTYATINNNTFTDNDMVGIVVSNCRDMTVKGNIITYNGNGIVSNLNTNCVFSENRCENNYGNGIEFSENINTNIVAKNVIMDNWIGMTLHNSWNNIVRNNSFITNCHGMMFSASNNNQITGNSFKKNTQSGISIRYVFYNSISYNIFENNSRAINISQECSYNRIFYNQFHMNNKSGKQAIDETGMNIWNATDIGNYWSDWNSPDNNMDGIVDFPYFTDGGKGARDFFPMALDRYLDYVKPQISIINPLNGDHLKSPYVNVSGVASDNVAIDEILVSTDEIIWYPCYGISSWYGNISLKNGSNIIYAKAIDTSGNWNTTNVDVLVVPFDDVKPAINITSPTDKQVLSSNYTIVRGNSTDNTAILKVEISTDGNNWTLCNGTNYWSGNISLRIGTNTIYAKATDTSENWYSTSINVNVIINDTIEPTIIITSPIDGDVLQTNEVTAAGTASDNVAILKVEISIDGINWILCNGTTSWTGDIILNDGRIILYAKATDTSNNTKTSLITITYKTTSNDNEKEITRVRIIFVAICVCIVVVFFIIHTRGGKKPTQIKTTILNRKK